MRELRADIGIALDGDADRVLIVDEKGQDRRRRPAHGGRRALVARGRPPVAARRRRDHHVESRPRALPRGIGLTLARTAVGDRYVLEYMREHGYNLGGEQSGHIILSDYTTTGDGLVAALQLLAVVKSLDKPVTQVCHCFEPLPQILKNVRYKRRPAAAGSRSSPPSRRQQEPRRHGRLVIRPSGTEPVIRVMGEGDNQDLVETVVDDVVEAVTQAASRAAA